MPTEEQIEKDAEITRVAELYEEIVVAADGGENVELTMWETSSLMTMMTDDKYRARVLAKHKKMFEG